jgi:glycosyltransferase involved in cell wall biosynthesis
MKTGRPRGFRFLFHSERKGKGAAIRTALKYITGSHVAIQDADLEYDPRQLAKLIGVAKKNPHGAVFGSRNKEIKNNYLYPHFYWGSKMLTLLIKGLYGYHLTDPETCQKLIPANAFKAFVLTENGFGIEIEIIANIARFKLPVYEVAITYEPRSFSEGKKIRSTDGIRAIYLLGKFRWRRYPAASARGTDTGNK